MEKIIFCVTNDLNTDQRMQRICSTLAADKYIVELVGRQKSNSQTLSEQTFQQKRLSCYFQVGKLFYIEYNIRLLFYLLKNDFDAVCAIDLDTIAAVYWVAKIKSKPRCFDAHEYFEEVPEVTNRKIIKWIWKKIGAYFVPKMNLCYTVGPCLAEMFEKKYRVKFHVIRNLPITKNLKNIQTPLIAQPYLLYQGALNEGRGLEVLIDSMQELTEYRLLIAGDGDLTLQLKALVKEKELQKSVIFLGNLPPEELDSFTSGAYVGLNLLENNGLSYYYSLANKFFDYVQFGVPVVTMNFPEYRALNLQYEVAVLLTDLNKNSLVEALHRMFNDISFHQALRRNCLIASQEWIWENEAPQLLKIWNDLLRKS